MLSHFGRGEPVPGCQGDGVGRVDYCYLPEGASLPTLAPVISVVDEISVLDKETTNRQQVLEIRSAECSESSPCHRCQGGKFAVVLVDSNVCLVT